MNYYTRTLVLAGNERQYKDFLKTVGDKEQYFYAGSLPAMMGKFCSNVQTIGTFWDRPRSLEMFSHVPCLIEMTKKWCMNHS